MYAIWEEDPDDPLSEQYTLWGETSDLDEAIDIAREIGGYITDDDDEVIADYRG